MLNVTKDDVKKQPFPHVLKKGILPAELFARLKADYPDASSFAEQNEISDSSGSRMGAGKGFDIYRGDQNYDRLIASSDTWAEFDSFINSPEFVNQFLDLFGDHLEGLGIDIEVDPNAYDNGFVEGRDALNEKRSGGGLLSKISRKLSKNEKTTPRLFTRLDIQRGIGGYHKPPHCDRANRLCSLILYFTDSKQEGIEGGSLYIYKHKTKSDPIKQERHPKPEQVDVVATISPEENLGVFFPCSNNSYHGVDAVRTEGAVRDFLYINISADAETCWKS